MEVNIFITSRFHGNPRGKGEALAMIEYIDRQGKPHIREYKTSVIKDTKNSLILKTCIGAMRMLIKPCTVTLYLNCDYIKHTQKRLDKWQQDNWKNAKKKVPANIEEWKQFHMLTQIHKIKFAPYCDRHEEKSEELTKEEAQ